MSAPAVSFCRHARPGARFFAPNLLLLLAVNWLSGADSPAADPLISAVRRNDAAAWQVLLKAKSGVTSRDADENSALHFAALNHDVVAVRALLAAGAEPDATNGAEATPLLYGAGHAEIVRLLLARGADANAASALKVTPLMAAVAHPESYDAVRLLVEAGADVRATRGTEVGGVLERAVSGGERRTIDLLLERGAGENPKAVSAALVTAAFEGNIALVRLMLERGGDPNFTLPRGHALNVALFAEHRDVARLLIERGSDLSIRSATGHGTPPMVFSAYNQTGDETIAKALVAAGVDVNAANDHGMTAMAYAMRSGAQTPLVEYLQSVGAKSPAQPRAKRTPERAVPANPDGYGAVVKERMQSTLDLLQLSSNAFLDNGFVQQAACTSCHGQDLPPVAYELARARGFKIDDVSLGRQLAAQTSRWNTRAESARQMIRPVPGAPVAIAYGLFGLRAAGYAADDMTDAMVRYILRTQKTDGRWDDFTRRPPIEDGTFVASGWVPLAVRDYAPAGYKAAVADSQARSARWLAQQEPVNHNEAAFQLLGLHWSGVPAGKVDASVERLVRAQRPDGGWAQLPGLESDAWATGTALYALHKAADMKTTDAVYQRGVAFLLRTQFEDGSWWVKSRAWPFQPHFNGQFPHGKDQWISQGATAWAAIALLLTIEPGPVQAPAPTAQQLMVAFAQSPGALRKKVAATVSVATGTVDFERNIQPLLERSCAGCHGGKKPRGGFQVATRTTLLKGGASGEPAITPGYADDSPLIQYVSGKIEDLEMPPLDRREKYPPLSATEIELLRTWIDAGAPSSPGRAETAKSKAAALEE